MSEYEEFKDTHIISNDIRNIFEQDCNRFYDLFEKREKFSRMCFKKDFPDLFTWFETVDAKYDYEEEKNTLVVIVPVVHKYFYDKKTDEEYIIKIDKLLELFSEYFCIDEPIIGFGDMGTDTLLHEEYGNPSTIPKLVDYESGFWEAEVVLENAKELGSKEIKRITSNMIKAAEKADAALQVELKKGVLTWLDEETFSDIVRDRIDYNE